LKKQNKSDLSTKRTLKRPQRLQSAAQWLKTVEVTGKQLVHAYSKKYNTDLLCSIGELRLLGILIAVEYEEAVKRSVKERIAKSQESKAQRQKNDSGDVVSDYHFAFIVGYTSGGAPFGLPWDNEDCPV
jgi:hypothetical protein